MLVPDLGGGVVVVPTLKRIKRLFRIPGKPYLSACRVAEEAELNILNPR